mgnify:FL=1
MKATLANSLLAPPVRLVLALMAAGATSACAPTGLEARRTEARSLAAHAGWERVAIDSGRFVLIAHRPRPVQRVERLSVYIEGDGLAWLSRSEPSRDPTPLDPVALGLALRHPSGAAVHLGRPCQFTLDMERRNCSNKYWTSHRFAPEVVDSIDHALDRIKADHGAQALELVGYSGGGAIAALVAARRDDVERLITVAGNLDPAAWTRMHRITPLEGSLDPVVVAPALSELEQIHLSGAKDRELPAELAQGWLRHLRSPSAASLRIVPDFDHHCCWVEAWPMLYPGLASRAAPAH